MNCIRYSITTYDAQRMGKNRKNTAKTAKNGMKQPEKGPKKQPIAYILTTKNRGRPERRHKSGKMG